MSPLQSVTKTKPRSTKQHFFTQIQAGEIIKIISILKKKKADGIYGLSTDVLCELGDILVEPLAYASNHCMNVEMFPKELKLSKICDPKNLKELPALTLTKVFEVVMKNRLLEFFYFSPSQHGYRDSKSTFTAIIDISEEINNGF